MSQPQTTDLFEYTKVQYGDHWVRGIAVRCGYCPTIEAFPVNTFKGPPSVCDAKEIRYVTEKLQRFGWKVGNNPSQHRCPVCYSAIKAAQKRKNEVSQSPTSPPLSVVPPRTMTREDRRIIFEKLNEVYVSDKVGYGAGWTDEKVATDLGVPRAWVKLIRDENFGDEVANDEIRQTLTQASGVLVEIRSTVSKALELQNDIKRLMGVADKIEKSIETIRKAMGA